VVPPTRVPHHYTSPGVVLGDEAGADMSSQGRPIHVEAVQRITALFNARNTCPARHAQHRVSMGAHHLRGKAICASNPVRLKQGSGW
jgi:hypothetical protein